MMLAELKPDLSGIVGEPRELFRASSVGKDFFITDGPFVYRGEGGNLFMTWSNKGSGGYSVYLNRSDRGSLNGPWRTVGKLFSRDGGHGMLFKDLSGALRFVLHHPNVAEQERMCLFSVRDGGNILALEGGGFVNDAQEDCK